MTTASDPALEKKIEDAEEEIKDVKLKIKQVEAALEGLRAKTVEARDAAFGKAGIYADRGEEFLEEQLLALTKGVTELRKEKNLLLEARREERTSRDSNVAAVTMFSIKAEFEVAPTTPVHWFRSLLAKKLGELTRRTATRVFGRCSRSGSKITVDFLVSSLDNRAAVVEVVSAIAQEQCTGKHLSTSFLEISQQLQKNSMEAVADLSSLQEWEYHRQSGSPDGKFKREGRDFEDADDELRELFPKRAKSDGSSTVSAKDTQNAHVLFEATPKTAKNTKKTDTQIKYLIDHFELPCQDSTEAEMGRLQKLIWPYPYRDHQTYDKGVFFFSWRFFGSPEDGWHIHGVATHVNPADDTHPKQLYVPSIPESDWLTWQRALALRKAMTCLTHLQKILVSELKAEWAGKKEDGSALRQSMCYSMGT